MKSFLDFLCHTVFRNTILTHYVGIHLLKNCFFKPTWHFCYILNTLFYMVRVNVWERYILYAFVVSNSYSKVHVFWEGHKMLRILHLTFDWHYIRRKYWLALHKTKVRWRFRKILWPSQNMWTLIRKYMIGFRLLLLAFVWHGMEHIDFQGSWDFWSFPTFGVLCILLM